MTIACQQAQDGGATPSRVLYVSGGPLVPAKLGPARRSHHLLDQLCRFYDVSVLSMGTRADAVTFHATFPGPVTRASFVPSRYPGRVSRFMCKVWRTIAGGCDFLPALEPGLHRACTRMTSLYHFEAVVLSSVLLRRLPIPGDIPIIGDAHNVEFDVQRRTASAADGICRRQYARRQMTLTVAEERRCAHRVDMLLATSERDRELFRTELQVPVVEVVANGIDIAEFQPANAVARSPLIVFTGLLSYYPNQQGIRWFLNEVLPRVLRRVPIARLVIAGAAPPGWLTRLRNPHIEITGQVPDMRPHLARAAVVIAPLHIGGGTRVKILEALAMAKPVVSTSIGAEGLDLKHGHSILIADDAGAFAAQVIRVLTDTGHAAQLASNGRRDVAERFDWNRIGDHLERLLADRFRLTRRQDDVARKRPEVA